MMHFKECTGAARNAYHSFFHIRKSISLKPHFVLTRAFMNKSKMQKPKLNPNQEFDEPQLKALTGINDPNFTDHFKKVLLEPDFKKSFYNFSTECKKLYNEIKTHYHDTWNFRIDSKDGRVDLLFTFETEEDFKKFIVTTDSSHQTGFSSASLKPTQEGTGLFSGNICTDIPQDGNVKAAGYANFSSVLKRRSFYRMKFYDWSNYSHLVFKVRGDGRTYLIVFGIYGEYEENKDFAYAHPLYTRGGPYWQIAKIPLSHFYLISKGVILLQQNRVMMLSQIKRLGITALGFDGPFKLEIDYIGLEYDVCHKAVCPYESYR